MTTSIEGPQPTPKTGPMLATGGGIAALIFSVISWYMTNKGGGFTPDSIGGLITVLTSALGGLGLTGGGINALRNRLKEDWKIALQADPPPSEKRELFRLDRDGLTVSVSIDPAIVATTLRDKIGELLSHAAKQEVPK